MYTYILAVHGPDEKAYTELQDCVLKAMQEELQNRNLFKDLAMKKEKSRYYILKYTKGLYQILVLSWLYICIQKFSLRLG